VPLHIALLNAEAAVFTDTGNLESYTVKLVLKRQAWEDDEKPVTYTLTTP